MHGINTVQYSSTLPVIDQRVAAGTSQFAAIMYLSVDNPIALSNIFPEMVGDPEAQLYLKRFYRIVYLTNSQVFPMHCTYAYVRWRLDYTNNIAALMSQDGPNIYHPYSSPFTGDDFRKYCRIIKTKSIWMQPGKTYKFKIKSQYASSNRPITGDVEGNLNLGFINRKRNTTVIWKFSGQPVSYSNSNQGYDVINSSLGPLLVTGVYHTYGSYYRMDDAKPTSTSTCLIPEYLVEANNNFNPTYVNVNSGPHTVHPHPNTVYTVAT